MNEQPEQTRPEARLAESEGPSVARDALEQLDRCIDTLERIVREWTR